MGLLGKNKTEDHEKREEHKEHSSSPTSDPPPYDQVEPPPPPPRHNTDPGPSASTTITPDKCIVHLKFLAALADLRDQVACKDGLFGLFDSEVEKFENTTNEAYARIREKRWAVYTARAVKRFTVWWQEFAPSRSRPCLVDFESVKYSQIVMCKAKVFWARETMPPLDVMMVLHAYMLNPRAFLEDCIRFGKMYFWASEFPWNMINACINDQTLEYHPGRAAVACFKQKTGLSWDNLDDPPDTTVSCPKCSKSVTVPWIRSGMSTSLERPYENFTGLADKSFEASCDACHFTINHERLKLAKLHDDIYSLLMYKHPMPGTFLKLTGITKNEPDPLENKVSYPNKLIDAMGFTLLNYTNARKSELECESISDVAKELSAGMDNESILYRIRRSSTAPPPQSREKTALRRMMSHYWDNHSPFALDLVGAVIRQGTFIEKMDYIDWLHSPTVQTTMERSIDKYHIFFRIIAKNRHCTAVPTLDVDLAWHTHQLYPQRYYTYSTTQTRDLGGKEIFIDHDDKVEEVRLGDGFEWTSRQYSRETGGGIYSECTCWYCEAIRVPDLHGASSLLHPASTMRAREAVANLHNHPDAPPHPARNPHISSHGAVRGESAAESSHSTTTTTTTTTTLRDIKTAQLQANYAKACRRSEKRRKSLYGGDSCSSDDPATASRPLIWGLPCLVPGYAPYMSDPGIHGDAYAGNPGCMNVTPDGVGSCVAGTCEGSAAAGSCVVPTCGMISDDRFEFF